MKVIEAGALVPHTMGEKPSGPQEHYIDLQAAYARVQLRARIRVRVMLRLRYARVQLRARTNFNVRDGDSLSVNGDGSVDADLCQ